MEERKAKFSKYAKDRRDDPGMARGNRATGLNATREDALYGDDTLKPDPKP